MMTLTVAMVEAFYDELPRIYALEDIRQLDAIIAPSAGIGYYRELRAELAYVLDHGMSEDDHLKRMSPDELREHNRRQFAKLRAAMQAPVLYGPDGNLLKTET